MQEEEQRLVRQMEQRLEHTIALRLHLARRARVHEHRGRVMAWSTLVALATTVALVATTGGLGWLPFVAQLTFWVCLGAWRWQRHRVRDTRAEVERLRWAYGDQHRLATELFGEVDDG